MNKSGFDLALPALHINSLQNTTLSTGSQAPVAKNLQRFDNVQNNQVTSFFENVSILFNRIIPTSLFSQDEGVNEEVEAWLQETRHQSMGFTNKEVTWFDDDKNQGL